MSPKWLVSPVGGGGVDLVGGGRRGGGRAHKFVLIWGAILGAFHSGSLMLGRNKKTPTIFQKCQNLPRKLLQEYLQVKLHT
jgi:hypothetical protein